MSTDISTYLTSVAQTVVKYLNLNTNQGGLELFIDFLEMLLLFLREVLEGKYTLPSNTLDVILEILNNLSSITQTLLVVHNSSRWSHHGMV